MIHIINKYRYHMYNKMFECIDCGAKFNHKSRYDAHINRITSCIPPTTTCQYCRKNYSSTSALNRHLKTCNLGILFETKMEYERKIDCMKIIHLNERIKSLTQENMQLKDEYMRFKTQI